MNSSRKARVILLDNRHIDLTIQAKLYVYEFVSMVASHLALKEIEYFGLFFRDDLSHNRHQRHWLAPDKRVLDHDLPKQQNPLIFYFQVRFFVESVCSLYDVLTIELFYLQARLLVAQEQLQCDCDTIFDLASYVLQEKYSDYVDDNTTRSVLKNLPVLPVDTLKTHPSISYCEDQVIERYKQLQGTSRGYAVLKYMMLVERQSAYGQHRYELKDKSGVPWWMGISYRGLTIYDFNDLRIPRKEFAWKQLDNLYFRDRKFSIQVHDTKRSGYNSGRRPFSISSSANVFSWFSPTSQQTKSLWMMAVSQHRFYLDRAKMLESASAENQVPQTLNQIAAKLTGDAASLMTQTNDSQCSSLQSLSSQNSEATDGLSAKNLSAKQEMLYPLKLKKEALEEQLRKKIEQLKLLCLQESEITGVLPPETPSMYEGPRTGSEVRRRLGTSFMLSPKLLHKNNKDHASEEDKLELELEVQEKITTAALRLAQDKSVRRSIRKNRTQSYQRASQKLKEMESRLISMRLKPSNVGKDSSRPDCATPHGMSNSQCDEDPIEADEATQVSNFVPAEGGCSTGLTATLLSEGGCSTECSATPPLQEMVETMCVETTSSSTTPMMMSRQFTGYIANSVYRTRTQYRTQTYPTLCGTYKPDDFPSKELLENEIQEGDNLYNVQTKQIECYDSGDELRSPSPYPDTPTDSDVFPDQVQHSIPQSHSSDFLGNGTKVSTPGSCLKKGITAGKPDLLVDVQGTRLMSNKGSSSCSSVRRYQNRVEFSKPFEMSDFYKYSEKLRKCRSGSQTSPQPQ